MTDGAIFSKGTGRTRLKSLEAARKRIRDGEKYLIWKSGGWYRPKAEGYTLWLSEAGIFTADEARLHLDHWIKIYPAKSLRSQIEEDLTKALRQVDSLHALLSAARASAISRNLSGGAEK